MTENELKSALENLRKYKSGDYEKRGDRRVQTPSSIDWINELSCPNVVIINISQDHWMQCKRGPRDPFNNDGEHHTWTALSGSFPRYLNKGTVLIVRRTTRNSDKTSGNKSSGVMGIWLFKRKQRVESNENHDWNGSYSWYLHCTNIETGVNVVYKENWDRLGFEPTTMIGDAVVRLSQSQQLRYLEEFLRYDVFTDDTKEFLRSLHNCKK